MDKQRDAGRRWASIMVRLALTLAAALATWCFFSGALPAQPAPSESVPPRFLTAQGDRLTARPAADICEAQPSRPTDFWRSSQRPYAAGTDSARPVSEPRRVLVPRAYPTGEVRRIAEYRGPLPPYATSRVQMAAYVADPPQQSGPTSMPTTMGTPSTSSGGAADPSPPGLEGGTQLRIRGPESAGQSRGNDAQMQPAGGTAGASVSQFPWYLVRQLPDIFSPAQAPGPEDRFKIPLSNSIPPDAVRVNPETGLVTIAVRDAPLNEILALLAEQQGLNLICAEDITASVSITVRNAPLEEALGSILSVAGYTCSRQGEFLLITSVVAGQKASPQAQGREVRVFGLNYVSALDVDLVVKGLLSPVGQSFVAESDEGDHRKTQELLIVEDVPAYLLRIEQTVRQLDNRPRQVLIEAHVLSVELEDDLACGINFSYLREANPAITLETKGFADPTATQAMIFDFAADELTALVECLKTTTDAKTLASPKVFALNGQQARIQIGEQLGYRVTTTTQTSTMENVDFLEVGVILTVTPQITPEGYVLMKVKPQVSSGQINPDTELPEEETTEVETSVMLRDGHGIVIGGLIQEEDIEIQQKIPWIGDLWLVGRLFQKRTIDRKRSEIIIALIPHLVPDPPECEARECEQFERATTPLLCGPLQPYPRPFEASLPDASQRRPVFCKPGCFCPTTDGVRCAPTIPQTEYDIELEVTPPAYYNATPAQDDAPGYSALAPEPVVPSPW